MRLTYNDVEFCNKWEIDVKITGNDFQPFRDSTKTPSSAIENLDAALAEVIKRMQDFRVKLAAGSQSK